jgi:hypothetical protein
MKKFGVLEKTLEATMKPLNLLISGLEALTDWLGLTTAALDRNAASAKANNEKVSESSKEQGRASS